MCKKQHALYIVLWFVNDTSNLEPEYSKVSLPLSQIEVFVNLVIYLLYFRAFTFYANCSGRLN